MTGQRIAACIAAVTALSACGPRNLKDCIDDATRRPTDAGVRIARYECTKAFPPALTAINNFDSAPKADALQPTGQIDQFLGPKPEASVTLESVADRIARDHNAAALQRCTMT